MRRRSPGGQAAGGLEGEEGRGLAKRLGGGGLGHAVIFHVPAGKVVANHRMGDYLPSTALPAILDGTLALLRSWQIEDAP